MREALASFVILGALFAAPASGEPMVEAFETHCLSALQEGVAVNTEGLEQLDAESLGRKPMKMAAAEPPKFFALPGGEAFLGVLYLGGYQGCMVGHRSGHKLAPGAFAALVEQADLLLLEECDETDPDIAVATRPNSIGRYFMVSHSTSSAGNDELMAMERTLPHTGRACDSSGGGGN
ncbi:hypothetical protein FHY55_20120 [Oceanicola sp. D3]|uniref:hypothetical protein n=1 Tax=Oceanicola sp. D3 TaxID=2587163 RepID=UPI00112256C2|nr:hypothetical protein [Oceanicola sp. D3]QDC11393.1 hypothetical protein FHY55_20120 [Oceanicola sp. D3]